LVGLPERVGPFEVVGEIGRGGMGVVYLARQPSIGRMVAVKVLPFRDDSLADRLRQEATILGEMQHPHIVSVLDVGVDDGYPYYAMAYCAGGSLAQVLDRDGRLTASQTASTLAVVAEALGAMHARGLVHRDVKPSNVLLSADGEPFLADFGLAMGEGGHRVTTSGAVLGTIGYAAPELLDGNAVTGAADTFSLGVLGYQLLSGETPFKGAHVTAVIEAVRTGRCRPLGEIVPDAPPLLVEFIEQAMATDPSFRPSDLRDFATELRSTAPAARVQPVLTPADAGQTIARDRRSGPGRDDITKPITKTATTKSWKRPRVLAPAFTGLGVFGVALALMFSGVFGSSQPSSASAVVGYQLPVAKFSNGVSVSQSWAVSGPKHDQVRGTTTASNDGDATVTQPVDVVIPKGLAASVADVRFAHAPDSITARDPIVRYCVQLHPGTKRVLTYTTTKAPTDTGAKRLAAWAADWQTVTDANTAAHAGTPCKGASATAPDPVYDKSNTGVVTTTSPGNPSVALGTPANSRASNGTRRSNPGNSGRASTQLPDGSLPSPSDSSTGNAAVDHATAPKSAGPTNSNSGAAAASATTTTKPQTPVSVSTTTTTTSTDPATPVPVSTPPGAPLNLSMYVDNTGTLWDKWSAPASDGGSAITGYELRIHNVPGPDTELTTYYRAPDARTNNWGSLLSTTTPGSGYYFELWAENALGRGPSATSNTVLK
jgi:serine/threonine protein kinase